MPDNVPLAPAGGALSAPAGGTDAADRWAPWWTVYFAVVYATALVLVAAASGPPGRRLGAAAAIAAAAALYAGPGRRLLRGQAYGTTRQVVLYLLLTTALIALAQSQVSTGSWVLFAACPQAFMIAPLRLAIPVAAMLNLSPLIFLLTSPSPSATQVAVTVGACLLGAVFSVAFGTWVTQIVGQSRERAGLIASLEAARSQLAAVSREAGILAERERLAGEIHDTVAQGLTSILMLLEAADEALVANPEGARRHIALAARSAKENLAEARAMVAALAPAHLEADALPDALRRLARQTGEEAGIAADVQVDGPLRALPAAAEVVVLRAAQEALANVRKHSGARAVSVALRYSEAGVRLDVSDDGAGFDPEQVNGGYGLRGMRSRILQAGGSLRVRSRPGEGTVLSVEVPG